MRIERVLLSIVVGGMLAAVPVTVPTAGADDSKYSDRDRMRSSKDDKGRLEQALKTGEEKAFYRRELEKMGWQITSVNYDKPDYLEYEIVKGDQSFEVQIDVKKKVEYPKATTSSSSPERFSERDRMKSSKNEKEKLEQALKTGEEKAFYRRELEKMGWKITSVNYDKPDYVEYEIVKNDTSYEVQIDLDKNSHKATKVDVATNAWKTDATENALNQRQAAANKK